MDRALLSSVSAKVMRRRGVSNDLRDRGDEWPLLKVVKGLSVVVATVVDEVSIAAPSALRFCMAYLGVRGVRGRCGSSAAQTRCGLSRRTRRVGSMRNCAYFAALRPQAKFGPISHFVKYPRESQKPPNLRRRLSEASKG